MEKCQKSSVTYNTHLKQWEAGNGRGVYFASPDHRAVLIRVLKHDHPPMYRVVKGMCCAVSSDGNGRGVPVAFSDRILKAAALVAKSKVDIQAMTVRSQHGNGVYQVSFNGIPKTWTCACPDFAQGRCETISYGRVCKHCLSIMILRALGGYSPHPNACKSQEEFLQGMTERQAKRMADPEYAEAITRGDAGIFWYVYREVLSEYPRQLYLHVQDVLRITDGYASWRDLQRGYVSERSKALTAEEIRSQFCTSSTFFSLFEIPELDGEDYGYWWEQLWTYSQNGQLPRLKAELIQTFEALS